MAEPARLAVTALLLAMVVVGCRRPGSSPRPVEAPKAAPPPTPAGSPAAAADSSLALPDVTGFEAGATSRGAGYVRRTYRRDGARIEVTLARTASSAEDYAGWVKMSTASFPQATLDLPASEANGFYQCSDGRPPSCDLLIQLRAGLHIEVRGGGTSSRGDVDALARGLSLPTLVGRAAE